MPGRFMAGITEDQVNVLPTGQPATFQKHNPAVFSCFLHFIVPFGPFEAFRGVCTRISFFQKEILNGLKLVSDSLPPAAAWEIGDVSNFSGRAESWPYGAAKYPQSSSSPEANDTRGEAA